MIGRKPNVPSFFQKRSMLVGVLGRCTAVLSDISQSKKICEDIFEQDSATKHTAEDSMKPLNSVFDIGVVCRDL
jgi:hypothetical protein